MSKTDVKSSGIFIRVTDDFNKTLDKILSKSFAVAELKAKGYDIDKSVLGRFGYLLACKNFDILGEHLDILLAASKSESSEDLLKSIRKEMKK